MYLLRCVTHLIRVFSSTLISHIISKLWEEHYLRLIIILKFTFDPATQRTNVNYENSLCCTCKPLANATVASFGSIVYSVPSYRISAFDIRLILLPRYGTPVGAGTPAGPGTPCPWLMMDLPKHPASKEMSADSYTTLFFLSKDGDHFR